MFIALRLGSVRSLAGQTLDAEVAAVQSSGPPAAMLTAHVAGLHIQRVGVSGASVMAALSTTLARMAECGAGGHAVVTLGARSACQIGTSPGNVAFLPAGGAHPRCHRAGRPRPAGCHPSPASMAAVIV